MVSQSNTRSILRSFRAAPTLYEREKCISVSEYRSISRQSSRFTHDAQVQTPNSIKLPVERPTRTDSPQSPNSFPPQSTGLIRGRCSNEHQRPAISWRIIAHTPGDATASLVASRSAFRFDMTAEDKKRSPLFVSSPRSSLAQIVTAQPTSVLHHTEPLNSDRDTFKIATVEMSAISPLRATLAQIKLLSKYSSCEVCSRSLASISAITPRERRDNERELD